jgi:glycosyltransferase involved in cell wall biosynthesis
VVLKEGVNMTLVSSFTKDEPLDLFLKAASGLPAMRFYVTGDFSNADSGLIRDRPGNVEFTGYLTDAEYVGLLLASDAVLSLTKADHTMQRGAYEAVYLGRPVITSNFEVLRKAFYKGTVHVDNKIEDIARGIVQMRDNIEKYREEVGELRIEKLAQWERVEGELRRLLWQGEDIEANAKGILDRPWQE